MNRQAKIDEIEKRISLKKNSKTLQKMITLVQKFISEPAMPIMKLIVLPEQNYNMDQTACKRTFVKESRCCSERF